MEWNDFFYFVILLRFERRQPSHREHLLLTLLSSLLSPCVVNVRTPGRENGTTEQTTSLLQINTSQGSKSRGTWSQQQQQQQQQEDDGGKCLLNITCSLFSCVNRC